MSWNDPERSISLVSFQGIFGFIPKFPHLFLYVDNFYVTFKKTSYKVTDGWSITSLAQGNGHFTGAVGWFLSWMGSGTVRWERRTGLLLLLWLAARYGHMKNYSSARKVQSNLYKLCPKNKSYTQAMRATSYIQAMPAMQATALAKICSKKVVLYEFKELFMGVKFCSSHQTHFARQNLHKPFQLRRIASPGSDPRDRGTARAARNMAIGGLSCAPEAEDQ